MALGNIRFYAGLHMEILTTLTSHGNKKELYNRVIIFHFVHVDIYNLFYINYSPDFSLHFSQCFVKKI